MNTQVVFNIDKKVKERAMKRARSEGIPFSMVLQKATRSYATGDFSIEIIQERFNEKTRRELRKTLKEVKDGKGLSPAFKNADDVIKYLRSL